MLESPGVNTLAYLAPVSVTKKKLNNIDTLCYKTFLYITDIKAK